MLAPKRAAARRLSIVALLCALGVGGERLADRPPAWLREDPIVHPFGLDAEPPPAETADSTTAVASPRAVGGEAPGTRSSVARADVAGRTAITSDTPLAINRATRAQLEALPRIGPRLAARIIARRDSLGGLRGPQDLAAVKGIGPATLARLIPLLDFR